MSVVACPEIFIQDLAALLQRFAFRFANEAVLHEAMASVFRDAGHSFAHEHRFDAKNRADFYFEDAGVVVEVKVDGSLSEALRQAARYSAIEQVRGVLLAAATPWGVEPLCELPALHGRAFQMIHLQRRIL